MARFWIAKVEITDDVHRAASLVEEGEPNDTGTQIWPIRFRGWAQTSMLAVRPFRPRGATVVAAHRYLTSLCTADSVLATDSAHYHLDWWRYKRSGPHR